MNETQQANTAESVILKRYGYRPSWVTIAGGYASCGMLVWIGVRTLIRMASPQVPMEPWQTVLVVALMILCLAPCCILLAWSSTQMLIRRRRRAQRVRLTSTSLSAPASCYASRETSVPYEAIRRICCYEMFGYGSVVVKHQEGRIAIWENSLSGRKEWNDFVQALESNAGIAASWPFRWPFQFTLRTLLLVFTLVAVLLSLRLSIFGPKLFRGDWFILVLGVTYGATWWVINTRFRCLRVYALGFIAGFVWDVWAFQYVSKHGLMTLGAGTRTFTDWYPLSALMHRLAWESGWVGIFDARMWPGFLGMFLSGILGGLLALGTDRLWTVFVRKNKKPDKDSP